MEGCAPPKVVAVDSSSIAIGGDIVIPEDANITVALAHNDATPPVTLAGSFDNGSVSPMAFNWRQGPLTLNGGGAPQSFEVAGVDLRLVIGGFDNNFAMGTVEAAAGSNVTFVDNLANQPTPEGVCGEALYVHTLLIRLGSAVTVDNCRVYAEQVINEGGTIELLGCGSLESLCPGNFDEDCPLDLTDFAAFQDCFTGPGGGVSDGCTPADLDHDGDVDLLDFAKFQAIFGSSGE